MRRISWLSLAATSAALVATPAAAPSTHWTWRSLHRPLHIPHIAAGTVCPTSARTNADLGREGIRALPGRGPAYPNIVGDETVLQFMYPPPRESELFGSEWGGQKVLWWVAGSYHGPVLIRGRQLDGDNLVRFDHGMLPGKEIRIAPGLGYRPWKGARDRASTTRLRAEGCYAYQVDGTTFSRVIVFQAKIVPTPPG